VLGGDRLGDRRDVHELALDRVSGAVAGGASPPTVEGVEPEPGGEERPDDPERRVVGGRAVHEQERRTRAELEDGDPRAVG